MDRTSKDDADTPAREPGSQKGLLHVYQRRLRDHVRRCPICRHNVAGCPFGTELEETLRAVGRHAAGEA